MSVLRILKRFREFVIYELLKFLKKILKRSLIKLYSPI